MNIYTIKANNISYTIIAPTVSDATEIYIYRYGWGEKSALKSIKDITVHRGIQIDDREGTYYGETLVALYPEDIKGKL